MRNQTVYIHHEMQCAFCLSILPDTYQPVLVASNLDEFKGNQYALVTDIDQNWNVVDPDSWSPKWQEEVKRIYQMLLKVHVLQFSEGEV
jgi:hypothetical protein